MQSVLNILEARISEVMGEVSGQGVCSALVRPATDARFGDYQVNGVMPLAKQLKTNPRKLAEQIVAKLNSATADKLSDICETPEIAGPGFINLRLKPEFVSANLLQISKDAGRLGIEKAEKPKTIVVDFSGPNIAKQMHVGHLRSTIIGDSICRLLELQGHKIIRQNHIGDWGTQFGMLIERLDEGKLIQRFNEELEELESDQFPWKKAPLVDMEDFYKQASERYKNDPEFANKARAAVASLHSGDPACLELWRLIVAASKKHYQKIYEFLNVVLREDDTRGESFYKDMLADVVAELKKKGLTYSS